MLATAALFLVAAGCGSTSSGPVVTAGLLSASEVPGVPYKTTALTIADLAKDAAIPALPSMLTSWGYVQGAERTFQGESRHLTFVVSRSLVFKDASGAAGYVEFVHSHVTDFFGVAAVDALDAQGRAGWRFTPSACACHMANPVVVGVVSSGTDVAWLEINGPDATPDLLVSLMDPSKTVLPSS